MSLKLGHNVTKTEIGTGFKNRQQ